MIRSLVARIAVLLFVLALLNVPAHAYQGSTFRLRIEDPDTGIGRVITDNQLLGLGNLNGDENSAAGTIYFGGYVENFFVTIQATSATANPDGSGGGILTLSGRISYSQASNARIMITLEDSGYFPPPTPPVTFVTTVGGYDYTAKAVTPAGDLINGASSISLQSWLDYANNGNNAPGFGANTGPAKLAAMTVPITADAASTTTTGLQQFANTGFSDPVAAVPVASASGGYSMFSQATVAFSGSGGADFSITAADQTGTDPVSGVPEPTSLLLLGSAGLGLGFLQRKKQI